jgi:hypothetical protein
MLLFAFLIVPQVLWGVRAPTTPLAKNKKVSLRLLKK